jgi:hypothetical protein
MLWKMLTEAHPMSAHILESRSLTAMFGSDDAREGGASFIEKRPPKFTMEPSRQMPDFFPWWKEPTFPDQ